MKTPESLRALAAVAVYLLIFPPGNPPDPRAPRSAWIGSGFRYESPEACSKALAKSVVDAVTRKLGPLEQERARNGVCVRVD
jgi:hypothetical protein